MCQEITKLQNENLELAEKVEGLEQYSRVNSIDIVGIEEPSRNSTGTAEDLIMECLNGLSPNDEDDEDEMVTRSDIAICHILPKANNTRTWLNL